MILVPVGTKAQLIKMAPVMRAMGKQGVPYHFVLTGQHAETMDDLIQAFELPDPAYHLAPIEEANTSVKLASWLLKILKGNLTGASPLAQHNYKLCLVHGDTMSTLVAALLAKRHGIPVAHVEAGLRSFNFFHPFPEEIVRLAVSRLSDIFYCAGDWAINNLAYLRNRNRTFVNIGQNTLLDSLLFAITKPQETKDQDRYAIISIHRFENLSNKPRFQFIIEQILKIQETIPLKFVLHPATREKLEAHQLRDKLESVGIELVPRMDYVRFIALLNNAQFIMTDGGSNQEECYYLGLPCLIMRKTTERIEGIDQNTTIANYQASTIEKFMADALKHKRYPGLSKSINTEPSPSQLIASHIFEAHYRLL